MLELLFSFRGQIGRLRYFLTALAATLGAIAIVVLVVMSVSGSGGAHHSPSVGAALGIVIGGVALVLTLIWISFALQAKRIRDIGLDPILVIPGVIIFGIIDGAAAQVWPGLTLGSHAHQTVLGLVVQPLFGAMLLFWPGRSSGGGDAALDTWRPNREPGATDSFPDGRTAAEPAAPPRASGGWPAAPAGQTGFGRRGL